jgi:putative nucleotidyltransferase with HDIG domain
MTTVIEKVVLPILLLVLGALIVTNPMHLGMQPRIVAGVAFGGAAIGAALLLHRKGKQAAAGHLQSERVVLPPEVTVERILAPFDLHTSIQAAELTKHYEGKWLRFFGHLRDITPLPNGDTMMLFDGDEHCGPNDLAATFDGKWSPELTTLPLHQGVTLLGKIERVRSTGVTLADCELVRHNQGQQDRDSVSAAETMKYVRDLEAQLEARNDELQATKSELERSYDLTLQTLGDAIDLRNAETEGHSKRVTAFTIAIARAMGVPREQILVIARGAFLHDIGKMAIPDTILRKPGKLDETELRIMREHCYRGYQMLKKMSFLAEAADIVYAHQEHFDGTGYPRGLKGKEIPLGARIFAVADTLDAITSDRPYHPAKPVQAAREEIRKWSGRQFDPEIVKVFLSIPEKLWKDLRDEIDFR